MAESAELAGVAVPRLRRRPMAHLHEHLPGYLTVDNPIDNGAVVHHLATRPRCARSCST